jgi:hypothetical protein
MSSEGSQLTTEPEQANLSTVLKAHTPGTKRLVPNCYGKFTGLVWGPPHDKAILPHEGIRFETNVLDVDVLSHEPPLPPFFLQGNEAFVENFLLPLTCAESRKGGLRFGPRLSEGSFKICGLQVFSCDSEHYQRAVTFPLSNCRPYRLTLSSPDLLGRTVH